MRVSLNTIRKFIDFELPDVGELVSRINQQLGGVEEVIDLGAKYKDARIVVVAKCEKHPNADRLSVCLIDDNGAVQDVERNEDGLIQVVCGAPNARSGMLAVWLPPKSTVPATCDDKEPFVLETRELRGVLSNGMLAAADEMAIGNDHQGIVEISERDLPEGVEKNDALIGRSFAEVFGLDDTIIDIENKMFTHRPDLFGQLGVAREIAGISGEKFYDPKWYYELEQPQQPNENFKLDGFNETGVSVPRLMLVGLDNVTIKPSPLWLQAKLVALGSKPINNVVDVTNYVMLMTAQPTHAYDFDSLSDSKLGARMASDGEKIELLNGKTYELTADDIVIADNEQAVGLAGIMGGRDTEVSNSTTRIVLECANFDMYAVRKSSMRHGIFTDALTRFNKGQSMLMNPYAMQYAIKLLAEVSGATVATSIYDDLKKNEIEWRAQPRITPMLEQRTIDRAFINERLGIQLSSHDIARMLDNVGFDGSVTEETLTYWAPAWRMDIQDKEDVVEEVGRLYGFDKLPRELPQRSIMPAAENSSIKTKKLIRDAMQKLGANEVLTYSFVNEKVFKRAGQNSNEAFRITNALSPDLQYYRLSVLPSLLDKVHPNIKAGNDEFMLFEIGKGHNKNELGEDNLPKELQFVDGVYASKTGKAGAPYFKIQAIIVQLANDLGFEVNFKPAPTDLNYAVTAPFELSRSAFIESEDGTFLGMVGELKQSVRQQFKLPNYSAAFSLDFEGLMKAVTMRRISYRSLSKYPAVRQDISLKVTSNVTYNDIHSTVVATAKSNGELVVDVKPLAIYQNETDKSHTTYTFRAMAVSHDRTLTDQDMSALMDAIFSAAKETHNAERI